MPQEAHTAQAWGVCGLEACESALKIALARAPHAGLLARIHCMRAEAWLLADGSQDGVQSALEVSVACGRGPSYIQPCAGCTVDQW